MEHQKKDEQEKQELDQCEKCKGTGKIKVRVSHLHPSNGSVLGFSFTHKKCHFCNEEF